MHRPGRVKTNEPLVPRPGDSAPRRSTYSLRDETLAPEEVLFRRRGAPQRFAERDIYFAHESLPDAGRDMLPDSDMLKAVHGYASRFYEVLGSRSGGSGCGRGGSCYVDERSMDETALLAFGILLEEAGREALGREGDLVFTEGLPLDSSTEAAAGEGPRPASAVSQAGLADGEDGGEVWQSRLPKRRKVAEPGG